MTTTTTTTPAQPDAQPVTAAHSPLPEISAEEAEKAVWKAWHRVPYDSDEMNVAVRTHGFLSRIRALRTSLSANLPESAIQQAENRAWSYSHGNPRLALEMFSTFAANAMASRIAKLKRGAP